MRCCCFGAFAPSKKDLPQSQTDFNGFSSDKNVKLFTYNELRSATDNFNPRNRIGRGGFGMVFKGTLRNGTVVAAKVLSTESKQGIHEFLTEIDTITNVRHPNLVELLGCCVQENSRILVYEYVENKSLDRILLGPNNSAADLNWELRSAICKGAASGLKFLHEELDPPIVHRDIKASNILLDSNYLPKIGDFGLAKLFPDNVTHISTRVAGTTGYLAPEYALHGQLTKKADVYSFGVLIIEIISGRSVSKGWLANMDKLLLEWTWQLYEEGRLKELVDPNLKEYPEEEVLRYIKVALFCTQASANRRPPMPQVIEMLSKPIRLNEKELTPPGFIEGSMSTSKASKATITSNLRTKDASSSDSSIPFSSAPVTCTELIPR
ncbi:Non-specific serine/threonine protein kinase protein [Dioscorea alata]|uniref:Non-specific serine/threonine protein kinase protein n=2 Tax=Dioscorea alata TaxID=55571 RepID=A0ACB7TZD7_DIOAL|nr:Non-specific serine/threonine protein kinase protein [Dioscorea alata]KAH7653400.1 Non-specific serine/threonine protein kinase protein [Dioscorea alata]